MRISLPVLAPVLFFTVFGGVASAVKLEFYMMTKTKPPACEPSSPPAAATSFVTTDKEAYLLFYVTGAKAGDRVRQPVLHASGPTLRPHHRRVAAAGPRRQSLLPG